MTQKITMYSKQCKNVFYLQQLLQMAICTASQTAKNVCQVVKLAANDTAIVHLYRPYSNAVHCTA
jgi:hypothetical protein